MGMDAFLAEYYGTDTTKTAAAVEDYEKQASVELFCKLASEQGIDLNALENAQVEALFSNWVKAAAEEEPKDEKKEVEEKAKEEHEEKKAYAEKVAEADFLGRVMAHSYVQEMRKIAASGDDEKTAKWEPIEQARKALKAHGSMGKFQKTLDIARQGGASGDSVARLERGIDITKGLRNRAAGSAAKQLAPVAGGAALAAGGAYAAKKHHDKQKESSAIDQLAFERAQGIAQESGFDPAEAADKIAAAFTLNLVEESTKIASIADTNVAVEVRALELLERVGYPVEWTA